MRMLAVALVLLGSMSAQKWVAEYKAPSHFLMDSTQFNPKWPNEPAHQVKWTMVCMGFSGKWCDFTYQKHDDPELVQLIKLHGRDHGWLIVDGGSCNPDYYIDADGHTKHPFTERCVGQGREWTPDVIGLAAID